LGEKLVYFNLYFVRKPSFKTMTTSRVIILEKIKKLKPHLTDEEARHYLETLETYCELIINYTLRETKEDREEDSI
jgi:hypothetical protein